MGQFIDQHHFGAPGNDGLGIHLLECDAAIGDLLARNDLQVSNLCLRLGAVMRLHVAHHDVGAPALAAMPLIEHGIRLPDSSHRSQVDAQPAAPMWVAPGFRSCLIAYSRCGGTRNFQVAISQAIALEELLRIGAPLFAWSLFVGRLLGHSLPTSHSALQQCCISRSQAVGNAATASRSYNYKAYSGSGVRNGIISAHPTPGSD